jgi:hypothetical protein
MTKSTVRNVVLVALMGAFASVGTGCYADAGAYPAEGPQQEQLEPPLPADGPPQAQGPQQPYAEPPPQGQAPPYYADAPAQSPQVVVVNDYQPVYYGNYIVYYDGWGRPFYYNGGASYYVPYNSPYYASYVGHYRTYGAAYRGWYARGGYRAPMYRGRGGGGSFSRGGGYRGRRGGGHRR